MYTDPVSFEWDPNKAEANFRKHGIGFSEAVAVFSDDIAISVKDDDDGSDEERFVALGLGLRR